MGPEGGGHFHIVQEVPDEALSEAELPAAVDHDHEGVAGDDGTLRAHLEQVHRLQVPDAMSSSTQAGVHDRLHHQRGAADG